MKNNLSIFLLFLLVLLVINACNSSSLFPSINSEKNHNVNSSTNTITHDIEIAFPNLESQITKLFENMVYLTHPNDGSKRLFLVLKTGKIFVFQNDKNTNNYELFLDISKQTNSMGYEEGLLGLAFDPDYQINRQFYVYYSVLNPRRTIISMFLTEKNNSNKVVPNSEKIILEITQPFANHNGGTIVFGPDKYLYIGLGDGGSRGDPLENGQNPKTLLGSILRIKPENHSSINKYTIPNDNPFINNQEIKDEIWAYGLRNPWRFSFDSLSGDLWLGDVGQNDYEEINLVKKGKNYGWNIMEGMHCYERSLNLIEKAKGIKANKNSCEKTNLELPIIQYSTRQDSNCSVIGGYVYRGNKLPSLQGSYIYGDYCSGKIWALDYYKNKLPTTKLLVNTSLKISSFGEDADGEIYILSLNGHIYKFK